VLFLGVAVNQLASMFLKLKYGDTLPILNDLLLDALPYFDLVWLYDLLSILPLIIIVFYAVNKDFEKIPYIILLFGIINLIRGVFIGLTPFGSPKINEVGLFVGTMFRNGVYPSGHVGHAFLTFLLVSRKYKWITLVILVFLVITLLLARGHYSVDIFSALLFVYAVYCFGEKHFKKKFRLN